MKVLFVCTGNICRSPMAQYLFKKMLSDAGRNDVTVASAGISPAQLAVPEVAREALRAENVMDVRHESKELSKALLEEADLVFAMENHHVESIRARFPMFAGKVHLLNRYAGVKGRSGIRDPFGRPLASYVSTLKEIKDALARVIEKFKTTGKA